MKTRIFTLAFSIALIASCAEKEADFTKEQGDAPVFEAFTEDFGGTKTSLGSGNAVVWTKEDNLAIFQGFSIADKYQVSVSDAATGTAIFTLATDNSNANNSNFASGIELPSNIAYYPYSADITCAYPEAAKYELGVTLPEVQKYSNNSFGEDTFPMVAVTSSVADHTLRFMNVCGAIKLQLMGDVTIKSISIQGQNGEKLSGAATVHAYVDGTAPAISMAETAGASVTLDCGDGIKLEQGSATSFIIALPPVLFSAGFKLIVTDTAGNTTSVKTDRANTVHRSSILVMQPFKLGETPKDEDQDDEIPVATIKINQGDEYLVFAPGSQFTFTAAITPVDVPAEYLTWTSSDPSVATIDPVTGLMTTVGGGSATITAEAGGKTATAVMECRVTTAVPTADYIDEYGVNHGKGIAIMNTVWAPVNCGYSEANYPYGKLYQWGRKYGQGYGGTYGDVSEPTLSSGPVSKATGLSDANSNVFFTINSSVEQYDDWLAPQDDKLWNSGTEGTPVKTTNDPCPDGWRVPTGSELEGLIEHRDNGYYNGYETNESGIKGTKLNGPYRIDDPAAPYVFLPSAGERVADGECRYREAGGYYWSSTPSSHKSEYLDLWHGNYPTVYSYIRVDALSVRCVQE